MGRQRNSTTPGKQKSHVKRSSIAMSMASPVKGMALPGKCARLENGRSLGVRYENKQLLGAVLEQLQMPQATSTPVKTSTIKKKVTGRNRSIPQSVVVDEDDDHSSFNNSDPLFAELDIDKLSQEYENQLKSSLKSNDNSQASSNGQSGTASCLSSSSLYSGTGGTHDSHTGTTHVKQSQHKLSTQTSTYLKCTPGQITERDGKGQIFQRNGRTLDTTNGANVYKCSRANDFRQTSKLALNSASQGIRPATSLTACAPKHLVSLNLSVVQNISNSQAAFQFSQDPFLSGNSFSDIVETDIRKNSSNSLTNSVSLNTFVTNSTLQDDIWPVVLINKKSATKTSSQSDNILNSNLVGKDVKCNVIKPSNKDCSNVDLPNKSEAMTNISNTLGCLSAGNQKISVCSSNINVTRQNSDSAGVNCKSKANMYNEWLMSTNTNELIKGQSDSHVDVPSGREGKSKQIHLKTAEMEDDAPCNDSAEIWSDLLQSKTRSCPGDNFTTPTSAAAGSLREKIRKRLQDNAKTNTPQMVWAQERLRKQLVTEAERDSLVVQDKGTAIDIGPFYGLPSKVKELLQTHRHIKQLYAWQDECLILPAVARGENLIYSLPTSGGKTLVAEILILRELLCKKHDALLILPFVALVQEKVKNMSEFALDLDFLVEEYAASKGRFPPVKRRNKRSLFVATIEKAHTLVNSLIEQKRISDIGLVVIDELHMLGEGGSRGSTLEMTLLKLLYTSAQTQIIGMSATLSNTVDLQKFLSAEIYNNDFRPVKLTEYVKLGDSVYQVNNAALCPDDQLQYHRAFSFKYPPGTLKDDPDHLLGLVLEVVPQYSCLLFCPTKKNCENVAMNICKLMSKCGKELVNVKRDARKSMLAELLRDGSGTVCPVLRYTLQFGVAYHHSGLTMDERRLIEDAYADGTLCLLACTSTLAAGINLPAKRVILRSPRVAADILSRSQYKQMVGRAGRAGIDTSGESILVCPIQDRHRVHDIIAGPIEKCISSLNYDDNKGVRSLVLSTVGLGVTQTLVSLFELMSKSLLSVQSERLQCDVNAITQSVLQQLIDKHLVKQIRKHDANDEADLLLLEVTDLGRATYKGSVDIDYASQLYDDLIKARDSLVISNYLHLLYLVTPYDSAHGVKPDWMTYFHQMSRLSVTELRVAALVGVPEGYIARKASGQVSKQKVDLFVLNRFYLTLMLYDLWCGKTIWQVASTFQQPRGYIQSLLTSASSFAVSVLHFCQEFEDFWAFVALFEIFSKRLSFCVSADLIPLMEIPGVKAGRAKQLHLAGYKTLAQIAHADSEILVKDLEHMSRKVARQIICSAKVLLNEKTESLLEEVEELVTVPEQPLVIPVQITPVPEKSNLSLDYSHSNMTC